MDIIVTFFTGYFMGTTLVTSKPKIAIRYLRTFFVFDIISTLPSLFSGQSSSVYFLKLFRFVHFRRLFVQIDFLLDQILFRTLGLHKTKV